MDLGEVIGAMLNGLIEARARADLTTVEVARLYASEPLLKGFSIPRVRIPEMTIDLPVVLSDIAAEEPPLAATPTQVADAVKRALYRSARLHKATGILTRTVRESFHDKLRSALEAFDERVPPSREATGELAKRALSGAVNLNEIDPTVRPAILSAVEAAARGAAHKRAMVPLRVHGTVLTRDIKEETNPDLVTRIRFTVREEGVEWTTIPEREGEGSVDTLTPE